jgi:peptide/nickel transport system permease protein
MLLTALVLSFMVFFLTNQPPMLEKVAKYEGNSRMSDEEVARYLTNNGFGQPMLVRYGEWLGVLPGWTTERGDTTRGRCIAPGEDPALAPRYCGVLQGEWGVSRVFRDEVSSIVGTRLYMTGKLMLWVMLLMVPSALVIGVLAGMREGSKLDRSLSTFSIATTATPEYVSGVILISVFASSAVGLKWFKGTATAAMENATFENFFLPVLTIALYGMGYIARMTRASMAEVMTAQYIRTARLKGVSFGNIVLKHALRNALIAPFTVIMLQFPWLLNGVVIVETLFNYKGLGWALVQAAGNNDIELLMGISVVSVFVVLVTQLISDIGYVYLNPRIRIS